MSQLIAGLAGAGGAATQAGSYYQNALNQIGPGGTAAAKQFAGLEQAGLTPQFTALNENLSAQDAAQGIGTSGSAKANANALTAQESGVLANAEAPLYSQSLGAYDSILGQEPGAQNAAYQQAINNFYSGITDVGEAAAGIPPTSQPSQVPGAPPQDIYGAQSDYYGQQPLPSASDLPGYSASGYDYGSIPVTPPSGGYFTGVGSSPY